MLAIASSARFVGKTALVLSGAAKREQVDEWKYAPDFVFDELSKLLG